MTKVTEKKTEDGQVKTVEPKPGAKTSEFWGTMLAHFVALIIIAIGQAKGNDALSGFGAILSSVAQGTYNVGRGLTKRVG